MAAIPGIAISIASCYVCVWYRALPVVTCTGNFGRFVKVFSGLVLGDKYFACRE